MRVADIAHTILSDIPYNFVKISDYILQFLKYRDIGYIYIYCVAY